MGLEIPLTPWDLNFRIYKNKKVGVDDLEGSLPALKDTIIEQAT